MPTWVYPQILCQWHSSLPNIADSIVIFQIPLIIDKHDEGDSGPEASKYAVLGEPAIFHYSCHPVEVTGISLLFIILTRDIQVTSTWKTHKNTFS